VACTWRIRHKLMLGMLLMLVIMAMLLGGTLHGLTSYRGVMAACESKLDELQEAAKLKAAVQTLARSNDGQDKSLLRNRMWPHHQFIQAALNDYKKMLDETVAKGRARDHGTKAYGQVDAIDKILQQVEKELKSITPQVGTGENNDQSSDRLRESIETLEVGVSDLIDTITDEVGERVTTTRKEARKSIILLITTSVMAIMFMAGLLRFFYRWVAEPIRALEQGVSRVARGDFAHRIDIKSGDEIEDLANAYNEMTDKLRAMYENLAQQVNERSRQLVRSEQLAGVGFLAAGVAHEINNPLASIAFCSEALESRLDGLLHSPATSGVDRETIAKYLKMIQEEAFRCKEITQKLLAFSRGGERKREETDLGEIIQSVLDVVQHLQNCKGKRVEFRPVGPMLAWVNAQEVKQVFLNLVINALESMDEGGILTIQYKLIDDRFEFTFKDTGCGMTPDVLDNIFQPFFTRSKTGKGTGLGLSISHRIITQHGGDIEAASDGPGQGSTFLVRLPIHPPANQSEPGQEVQDPVEEFLKLSMAKAA
jgi:two-component system, NtrC family, sensor kinase